MAAPGVATLADDRDLAGEAEIVANVNALRAEAGLDALSRDSALDRAAALHSRDMQASGQLVHVSERTGNPADRVRGAGVQPERVGENIAQGADAAAAYASIVASEVHREQLLDPAFTHLGVAVVRSERGVYLTQVLARLTPAATQAPPPAAPVPLPPPSVQDVPEAPAADAVPRVEAAPSGATPALDGPPLPPNAPLLRVPVLTRPVRGYWVWHANRWWYFDLPENAQAGQLLRPNLDVTGPPPGYAAVPPAPGHRIQVWPR
ncbi:MAG: CAP domain-containing protein, partial [Myxococcota bacterium]